MICVIFDSLSNVKSYLGISDVLDAALTALAATDFSSLPPDEYLFGDGGTYFIVQELRLKNRDETRWECHDQYIDIQYMLSGDPETIDYAPRQQFAHWVKNGEKDIYFSDEEKKGSALSLNEGYFAVFFPQDAHRPCQGEEDAACRKIVFKVPIKEESR